MKSMPHAEHCALLAPLSFTNDSHWCYTNAALAAWFWSTLSSQTYDFSHWGTLQSCVAKLLIHNDRKFNAPSVTLRTFFPDLFQRWQQDSRQGDAAEFTSLLLVTADSCCVKQSWEQRLIVPTAKGITVTVHDHGSAKMLINLCPNHDFSGPIELADLFQTWHEALGMSTALLDTPSMLCCQFERLNAASTRRNNPIHFDESCQVPIFCGPNIDIDWMEFTPVAMVAHTGSAHSGH